MYTIKLDHRDGSNGKSQWTISENDEVKCFGLACTNGWLLANKGWGLHIVENEPDWLGIAQDQLTQVFIAKFVDKLGDGTWHGYPADHRNHVQDIPGHAILKAWLDKGILASAKIRKIMKGQPCNL